MASANDIIRLLTTNPALSDREIIDRLLGNKEAQQSVNHLSQPLVVKKLMVRRSPPDGIPKNYPAGAVTPDPPSQVVEPEEQESLQQSEDQLKHRLETHLCMEGWDVRIAWGKRQGADIEAEREGKRWLIEVKGIGSRPAMRVNYFLAVLGELLGRMKDANAKYSIAVPDVPQFRKLWRRFPAEAKARTQITALFVGEAGIQEEM